MRRIATFVLLAAIAGCGAPGGGEKAPEVPEAAEGQVLPVFTLATSEYPSWSTFVVAGNVGIVNPVAGGDYGPLEEKWGVDVVIEAKDYDACLTLIANGAVDAACITNIDSLNSAMGRACTAICPTSTSAGADKVISVTAKKAEDLKGTKVYGLAKSVSEVTFVRGLEKQGLNPAEFEFVNLDPAPASTAIQTGSNDVKAICVWNPFALQTLRTAKDSTDVFNSSLIEGEIVDQVVMGNDSLAKESGEGFAACLCDIFYTVCDNLWSSDQSVQDATRTALKEDFAPDLSLEDMKIILSETKFYRTSKDGTDLYKSDDFKKTMDTVVATCQAIGILEEGKQPTVGYDDPIAQLNFTAKYMEKAVSK